jgi:hypothetical protein
MTIGNPLLAFLAGILSILSPCVLPILPIVLGRRHQVTATGRWRSPPGCPFRSRRSDCSSQRRAIRSDWMRTGFAMWRRR